MSCGVSDAYPDVGGLNNSDLDARSPMSSGIFTKGVSRKSDQLREISGSLADIIQQMDARVDLSTFDSRHPGILTDAISDLKEARKMIYRAVERINFPDKFSDTKS